MLGGRFSAPTTGDGVLSGGQLWPFQGSEGSAAAWEWTSNDKRQVSRAAKSLALALSMDNERASTQLANDQFRVAMADSLHQVKSPLQALRTFGKLLQRQLAEEGGLEWPRPLPELDDIVELLEQGELVLGEREVLEQVEVLVQVEREVLEQVEALVEGLREADVLDPVGVLRRSPVTAPHQLCWECSARRRRGTGRRGRGYCRRPCRT